jgi:putative hydrolase of the HAD superfamily
MSMTRAVIFDLGGTLVEWPDEDPASRWGPAYDRLGDAEALLGRPERAAFVEAMVAAERAHWRRVETEHWSGPPSELVREGLTGLQIRADEPAMLAVLDAYAGVAERFSVVCDDAVSTLETVRRSGYRLSLLSNTWWAAKWHDAELAAHGLAPFFDAVIYTSDLPHSKPHPAVFQEAASRLNVEPSACVMVGDRQIDDIGGALDAGMRAIWKQTGKSLPTRAGIVPTASITRLSQLPPLLARWREDSSERASGSKA